MRLITRSHRSTEIWKLDETYKTAQEVLKSLNKGEITEIDTEIQGYKGINTVTINPAQLEWWSIVNGK